MLIKKPFKKGFGFNAAPYYKAAGGGGGTVTLDAAEASAFSLGSGTTQTDNGFTVGAGSNQLLVVAIAMGSNVGGTITGTWNGTSLGTPVVDITNVSVRSLIFALKNPAQGNKSLVLNNTANWAFSNSIACSFNGVDQTTPTQNPNTATGSASSFPITITTANGNATVMTAAASSTLTAIDNVQLYANSSNGTGAARQASSSGSTTFTGTGGGSWAACGIDLKAA